MWISKDKWERLNGRIEYLENKTGDISCFSNASYSGHEWVRINDAIRAILDHLELNLSREKGYDKIVCIKKIVCRKTDKKGV